MAQYKVLQDIEAEDKLLGPLTLRQFIYAVIVIVLGFISWRLLLVQWLLVLPFLPPMIFFALLAAPFGRDQSSEVWLLAKIKYFVFPKKRVWNQDGVVNLVSITAPKVVAKHYTKDFDKAEAKSRLKALASTMDTRGWAVKNMSSPGYQNNLTGSSDRLLDLQESPPEEVLAVKPQEDVLDQNTNPLAQALGNMQAQSDQTHRQEILQKMQVIAQQQKAAQANLQSIPAPTPTPAPPKPAPQPVVAKAPAPVAPTPAQPVTPAPAPAILKQVKSPEPPSELQVKNQTQSDDADDNEVVISLH